MGEDQYTSQTTFEVKRVGGPNWTAPQGMESASKGQVIEKMHFWDDSADDFTVVDVTMTRWSASPDSRAAVREARSASFELSTILRRSSVKAGKTPVPSR